MMATLFPILMLAFTSAPGNRADLFDNAVQLYTHGDFERAAATLTDLSQADPGDAETRLWLGKSLLKIRKWDDAVREMRKAVELQPNNAQYRLWLGRANGNKASHSFFLTALGWAKEVVKAFQAAEMLAPKNLDVRFDLLQYYLDAPGTLGGGRDKAEAEARAIAQLNPAEGFAARASIYEKAKKWDQAKAELVQATIQFPNRVDSYLDLTDFLLMRQDLQGASASARKAVSLDPDLPRARMLFAATQIKSGTDLAEAERSLIALSKGPLKDDDPSFEEIFYWLGQAYLAQGKKSQARESFSTALRYNPDYDKAKSGLSRVR